MSPWWRTAGRSRSGSRSLPARREATRTCPQVSGFTEATSWVAIAGASSGASAGAYAAPANYTTNAVLHDAAAETFRVSGKPAYRSGAADPENPAVFNGAHTGAWCAATMVLKEAPAVTTLPPKPLIANQAVDRAGRW